MKKTYLALATIALISLASCKKDYTCECTYSNGSGSTTSSTYTITDIKSDAEAECNEDDVTFGGAETDCELQ